MAHIWPLFDLRITTPRLELRLPTDDDLVRLAGIVADGVHAPDFQPFSVAWALAPSPEREREFLRYQWQRRADVEPAAWRLPLCVAGDDGPMGLQDIAATRFAETRSVTTGSWLGQRFQGRGVGTEMRAAVLELAFVHLHAVEALSAARADNRPSLGVSRRLGYADNGVRRTMAGDEPVVQQDLRLDRDTWLANRLDIEVAVAGLDPCRELLGAER